MSDRSVSPPPTERFTETAALYKLHRPGYPDALWPFVERTTGVRPGARVLDLGCGTGISTRFVAARGHRVLGIDPNEEMLAAATDAGGAEYARGECTRTGRPDASAELVTA